MVHTSESRSFYVESDLVSLFVAPSALATLSFAQAPRSAIIVPRHMRMTLDRMHGSFVNQEPFDASNRMKIMLAQVGDTIPTDYRTLRRVWNLLAGTTEVGAATNAGQHSEARQIEVDFGKRSHTSLVNTGSSSNQVLSWRFLHITLADFSYLLDLVLSVTMEWLPFPSGPNNLSQAQWEEDENA